MGQKDQDTVYFIHQELESKLRALLYEEPASLAFTVNTDIDEHLSDLRQQDPVNAARVSCTKGCSACCHIHVTITKPEAALLVAYAAELGLPIDPERLQRQADHGSLEQWRKLPAAERACVFLGPDGACQVYEHRPSACRRHLVLSPPEDCDSIAKPNKRTINFVSVHAEILASAAMSVFESGTMAAMLLATEPKETPSDQAIVIE